MRKTVMMTAIGALLFLFAQAFGLDVGLALAGVLAGPRMSGSAYRFSR
jgi:uncharacterized membrane protein